MVYSRPSKQGSPIEIVVEKLGKRSIIKKVLSKNHRFFQSLKQNFKPFP